MAGDIKAGISVSTRGTEQAKAKLASVKDEIGQIDKASGNIAKVVPAMQGITLAAAAAIPALAGVDSQLGNIVSAGAGLASVGAQLGGLVGGPGGGIIGGLIGGLAGIGAVLLGQSQKDSVTVDARQELNVKVEANAKEAARQVAEAVEIKVKEFLNEVQAGGFDRLEQLRANAARGVT